MNRAQLEHVIRAAATIAGDTEIVVIGSQAILGRYPQAPAELVVSSDVDLFPRNHPERADLIEGSIGELSPFHETYGYYRLADRQTLLERLALTAADETQRGRITAQIEADFRS